MEIFERWISIGQPSVIPVPNNDVIMEKLRENSNTYHMSIANKKSTQRWACFQNAIMPGVRKGTKSCDVERIQDQWHNVYRYSIPFISSSVFPEGLPPVIIQKFWIMLLSHLNGTFHYKLVGGLLPSILFSHILGIIIPIDELIFFRGVNQPTRSIWVLQLMEAPRPICRPRHALRLLAGKREGKGGIPSSTITLWYCH